MTMSKPMIRVALFLVISLTLIAATYMTVQGALKSEANRAQVHQVNGLQTDLNHDRLSSAELQNLQMNNYAQPGSSHHSGGCHSDTQQVPQD